VGPLWAVLTILLQAGGPQPSSCDVDLEAWLACNNPRAIRYFGALSQADVGKVLKGVTLTDGKVAAKGYRLIALPKTPKGVHIVAVRRPNTAAADAVDGFLPGGDGAFVWVDPGGAEVLLPKCLRSDFENQYVLSGDVYTWKAVQPGHGVVEVGCINPDWTHTGRK
jgi:hypothetical protein